MPRGVYQRTVEHGRAISDAKRGKSSSKGSEAIKKKWQDPEYRAKQLASRNTDEYRQAVADRRRGFEHDQAFRDGVSARKTTHGLSAHPFYRLWTNVMHRCYDATTKSYPYYGARGIEVCEAWHDPATFISYIEIELGPRPERHSLDRIDNNGNYEPGNLRWATNSQQMLNRRPASEWRNARAQANAS